MPTIPVLAESDISLTNGTVLSGFNQGDGSHLVGEFLTINSLSYEALDINDSNGSFQDNSGSQTLNGTQDLGGVTYANGLTIEAEYKFVVEDPAGIQYTIIAINIREPGSGFPSYGTIEGLAFIGAVPPAGIPLEIVSASEGNAGGAEVYTDVVCFTKGTLIATPSGQKLVENLEIDDLVVTKDNGFQRIRWIGRKIISSLNLRTQPNLRPVRIRAHAFGQNVPERDLIVSQQHRVLIEGQNCDLLFGTTEILAPAIGLINDKSIEVDLTLKSIEYIHILFDEHQIVYSNGAETESYQPGDFGITTVENAQREELLEIFPELSNTAENYGQAARISLKPREVKLLMQYR